MACGIPFRRIQSEYSQASKVHLHHVCDLCSGFLICGMVIFCPWAFGTTQSWSIWTMNLAGYALGLMLLMKLWVRDRDGTPAARWETPGKLVDTMGTGKRQSVWVVERTLGAACALLLLYVLVSAINARATYIPSQLSFEYRDHIRWLPHSLDSSRTWKVLWNYLALAATFWAMRDWLLGKSAAEERLSPPSIAVASLPETAPPFPRRLHLLLCLLALNGGLLAIEGIIQRLEGSSKLLFLVHPRVNPGAVTQFGPWAYRANAAAWFNLLWPVCLGFWWTLHHHGGYNKLRHHWLLF